MAESKSWVRNRRRCCPDGFGSALARSKLSCRTDDIYVSPNQVRKYGLRTGDTVEGEIRAPKDGERYFALTRLSRSISTIPTRCATASTSTT